jgi:hypothetical protein
VNYCRHTPKSAPATKSCHSSCGTRRTRLVPRYDGISFSDPRDHASVTRGVEPGRAPPTRLSRKARMLLSFQRPSRPAGKGSPSKGRSPRAGSSWERAEKCSTARRRFGAPGQTRCPCPAERKYTHSLGPRVARSSRRRPRRSRHRPDPLRLQAIRAPRPAATVHRPRPDGRLRPGGPGRRR